MTVLYWLYLCIGHILAVTCAADEFRCASGNQCVDPYCQCNGVADCDDASDETVELCGTYVTLPYSLTYLLHNSPIFCLLNIKIH